VLPVKNSINIWLTDNNQSKVIIACETFKLINTNIQLSSDLLPILIEEANSNQKML
jgi:hypothetical protein